MPHILYQMGENDEIWSEWWSSHWTQRRGPFYLTGSKPEQQQLCAIDVLDRGASNELLMVGMLADLGEH